MLRLYQDQIAQILMCPVAIFHVAVYLSVRSRQDKKSVAQHNQAISYCLGNYRAVNHPVIVYFMLPPEQTDYSL